MASDRRRRPAGHESRVFAAALLAGLPAVLVACWLLWAGDHPAPGPGHASRCSCVGAWLIGAALVRERVLRPLQTIANLLAALREGDYSIRARGASADDGLGPRAARGQHAERYAALAAARARSRPRRCSAA